MTIIQPSLIESARLVAHAAHDSIGHRRKYTGEPYWVHTDEVASIVASVMDDESAIMAAHLHDVIEDVFPVNPLFSLDLIREQFGDDTARHVFDLTDQYTRENYPEWNRKVRKQKEAERMGLIDPKSATIKLADLLSNSRDIIANDPNFARTYLREKHQMLPFLRHGHDMLLMQARQALKDGYAALDMEF